MKPSPPSTSGRLLARGERKFWPSMLLLQYNKGVRATVVASYSCA